MPMEVTKEVVTRPVLQVALRPLPGVISILLGKEELSSFLDSLSIWAVGYWQTVSNSINLEEKSKSPLTRKTTLQLKTYNLT